MSETQTKYLARRAALSALRIARRAADPRRKVAAEQAAKREVAFARLRQEKLNTRAALSGEPE